MMRSGAIGVLCKTCPPAKFHHSLEELLAPSGCHCESQQGGTSTLRWPMPPHCSISSWADDLRATHPHLELPHALQNLGTLAAERLAAGLQGQSAPLTHVTHVDCAPRNARIAGCLLCSILLAT